MAGGKSLPASDKFPSGGAGDFFFLNLLFILDSYRFG